MTNPTVLAAARFWNIHPEMLVGPMRHRVLLIARAGACYVLRHRDELSLPKIGGFLGGRDHTTIMHTLKQCEVWRQTDGNLQTFIARHMTLPKYSREGEQEPASDRPRFKPPRPRLREIRAAEQRCDPVVIPRFEILPNPDLEPDMWERVKDDAGKVYSLDGQGRDDTEREFHDMLEHGSFNLAAKIKMARNPIA